MCHKNSYPTLVNSCFFLIKRKVCESYCIKQFTEFAFIGSKHYQLFSLQLCTVYQDLVKAFRAFDVGRSGFVSLEYLKSVLNTFIFPIRTDVFQELMNR